ncbi:MAG: response regulator [Verrucomicrobia bacterium]|nr:response regulator [Verrucomicrobiota bacterium]
MSARPKILLLDDDASVLEVFREVVARLPSKPEIFTATSGPRAIALLESEEFNLLVSDLSMPKMDGLQVLSIVRRKFPQLRTAILTAVPDEQFRARAYAIGVDIYFEKPRTAQEIDLFIDCLESLIGQETSGVFRGIQSKSLVDIIQLECLSQSCSVLKVANGLQEGKIWFQDGDVIDAAVGDLQGESAFQRILSWKTGNFETLRAEPGHERAIFKSNQALLLESAQALDEATAEPNLTHAPNGQEGQPSAASSEVAVISKIEGVEFVLLSRGDNPQKIDSWSAQNPEPLGAWASATLQSFQELGESLQAGQLRHLEGIGLHQNVGLAALAERCFCVGFRRDIGAEQIRETMKEIVAECIC